MSREAFGRRLRRHRLRTGVSLDQIAAETKIPIELLEALEDNDLSRWPVGIYARAYVRQYASAVGLDTEETVNEFCRWFPEGDRRLRPMVLQHASIVRHASTWTEELPESLGGVDRRQPPAESPPPESTMPARRAPSALQLMLIRLRRAFGLL